MHWFHGQASMHILVFGINALCPSLIECKQVLFYVLIWPLSSCPIELQHTKGGWSSGFIPIAEYGVEFSKALRKEKARKAVRLLYSGRNHYDLLVWGFIVPERNKRTILEKKKKKKTKNREWGCHLKLYSRKMFNISQDIYLYFLK